MNKEEKLRKLKNKGKWISNINRNPNNSFTSHSRLLYIKVIYQIIFPYNGLQEPIRGM